jgi:preprotein translocase subunit YajC
MSLLLVAATSHKANTFPFLMIGLGFCLLSYVQRLRAEVRQQREQTDSTRKKAKLSNRLATGSALLLISGIIWIIIEVSTLPK